MKYYLDSFKMKIQCYVILLTLTYTATLVLSDTASQNSASDKLSSSSSLILPIDNVQRVERSPKYDFGLGKRRYLVTSGGPGKKRLPHYNFGLGKRSNPYAYQFGLGKRADSDDFSNYEDDGDNYNNANYDKANINLEDWNDGGYMDNKNDIDVLDYGYNYGYPREFKRARQYSFGLGKRKYADELDKRLPNRKFLITQI
ncbi:allatostatin-A isoform X2 [Chironomus tepperi]|uniref:allatostatin-A isoform X2 n=1 Tax=Chironomus tepperi TaxID=113505 RepID=UPI00391FC068